MDPLAAGSRGALVVLLAVLIGGVTPRTAIYKGLLPAGVHADRYDLTLSPDAGPLTFKATLSATLRLERPERQIVFNALDLRIAEADLDGRPVRTALDPAAQTATFTPAGRLAAGRHVLHLAYSGPILRRRAGLFAVDATGPDGPPRRCRATYCSSRSVTSSGPRAWSTASSLAYLRHGGEQRAAPLLSRPRPRSCATSIATSGVRFALPKLDLVIAPGEVGAAMENWGAMLFGASSVLIDPGFSTDAERRSAALLVAHEMAHQWFGDLVTMGWWTISG